MSGCSSSGICPNCESKNYHIYSDWKPFNIESSECYECGFYTNTIAKISTLEELNKSRKQYNNDVDEEIFKPLSKLPEVNEYIKPYIKEVE